MSLFLTGALVLSLTVCSSQMAASTRVEENDPSIVYTGTWYTNGQTFNSGGGAALTNLKGAQATISFNGTGITWLGIADPWSGVARVYLDGVVSTVDTYASTTKWQQQFFVARNLPPGAHTLSIEVTHMRDVDGSGSWIWIDAFEIESGSGIVGGINASPGRVEQGNAALVYTGDWFSNTNPVQSGGSAALAIDAGSRVSLNFNGTGVKWIAYRDEWSGIARVYVDGSLNLTVDTYASPQQAQSTVFSIAGLALATHTLTIEVTGTHNVGSHGAWIWVDAFDVAGQ